MSLLTLSEIHVSFGPQVVLDGVDLTVHPGDRLGVVGPNGAGKSTMFGVILGRVAPGIGRVHTARGLRTGHLPQEVRPPGNVTLGDYLRSAFATTDELADAIARTGEQLADAEPDDRPGLMKRLDRLQAKLEAAGGYHYESRIGQVRAGLGIADIEDDRAMTALSGGQLSRAALARLLLTEPDLLLLDEPTNHLDLAAIEWLERFLQTFSGAMMVISHDRYLLDTVASKILHVEDAGARLYSMRFRDYETTRRIHDTQQQREFEKQQAFVEKERDFIRRFKAGQRSKEARGRETRLNRRISTGELAGEAVRNRPQLDFEFRVEQPGGDMIVRCMNVQKRYGERVLFDGFDLEIRRGEKVGILGPNGVGKSTLLKMLLGQIEPDDGRVRLMENLDVGYLDQHLATLADSDEVLATARRVRPDMNAPRLRGLLAHFGFPGAAVEKRVSSLSGGEQTRLALACMVLAGHQVLLLDEPTNHLDMQAREALEDALRQYPGSVIVVSHDRYFLDNVIDHLLVMGHDGEHVYFEGNYGQYQRMLAEHEAAAKAEASANRARERRRAKKQAAATPKPAPGADWPEAIRPLAKLSVAKLEEKIIELEFELEGLHARFADQAIYDNTDEVEKVGRQIAAVQEELARYNAAWEKQAE